MTHSVADDELRLSGTGTVVVPTKADPSVVDMEEDIDSLNGAEMIQMRYKKEKPAKR